MFTGVQREPRWLEVYGALVAATPYEDSRRAWSKADRRWASGKRQIIEGVLCQILRTSSLWSATGRRPSAGWIKDLLGRPPRHLADLLV